MERKVLAQLAVMGISLGITTVLLAQNIFGLGGANKSQANQSNTSAWQNAANSVSQQSMSQINQQIKSTQSTYPPVPEPAPSAQATAPRPVAPVQQPIMPAQAPAYAPPVQQQAAPAQQPAPQSAPTFSGFGAGSSGASAPSNSGAQQPAPPGNSGGWNIKY